ncbi:MAG: UTP--glucose-1-phosphate uridylyltransferase [Leptolyngbyaceae cyanobacterium MO_188.B28]|nr:UTP--glucose-1-phosphate uridylyltransferase [Leptolyngbyaceae cyanobacterium MO_188.B28]
MNSKRKWVRKALVPAAGFGTRLFPASKAIKKELFPVIDRFGRAKPVIQAIVEEAVSAGIEEVGIVVQARDLFQFKSFFQQRPTDHYLEKLAAKQGDYIDYLDTLGQRVTFLIQDSQEGFGHAVFCAREWVGDEPFLLLLGDHLYISDTDQSCAVQLVEQFEQWGKSAIAVEPTPVETISHRGCIVGSWIKPDELLAITQLVEKPDVDYAKQNLHVEGMAENELLAVFGMYVLTPQIFHFLQVSIEQNQRDRGEFQLTSCLDALQRAEGMIGCQLKGRSFDTGQPDAYRQALIEFRG